MKKLFSAVTAAVMAASMTAVPTVSAADTNSASSKTDGKKIVVLGDSIASGYGLSESDHNYGELLADYYGGSVSNFAHAGDTTKDLLALLKSPSGDMKKALEEADDVVISIGGNDMMRYAIPALLTFCEKNNLLVEGATAAQFESASLSDVMNSLDKEALRAYSADSGNLMALNREVNKIRANLTMTTDNPNKKNYQCIIEKNIIADSEGTGIVAAVTEIKNINPDAEIIVQSIYNPTQFEPSYFKKTYSANSQKALNLLVPVFRDVTVSFRNQLSKVEGIKMADVYEDFTSFESPDVEYGWYFTNIQNDRIKLDIHPNQAGNIAIASKIIDTIGTKKGSGDLIVKTFESLPEKSKYPAAALATYNKVTADTAKNVETITTTTTTTTSTTAKPTTTTTTSTTAKPTTTTTTSTTAKPTTTTSTTASTTAVTTTTTNEVNVDDYAGNWIAYKTSNRGISSGLPIDSAHILIIDRYNTGADISGDGSKRVGLVWQAAANNKISVTLDGGKKYDVLHDGEDLICYIEEGRAMHFKRTFEIGDANGDKSINSSDASAILSEFAARATGGSEMKAESARLSDVNFDGKVDAKDASDVLEYYSYKSTGGKETLLRYFKRIPIIVF